MNILRTFLPLTILVLHYFVSFAQIIKWDYLVNKDLLGKKEYQRFDDIYFTDYQNGIAVDLDGAIYKTKDGGSSWYFPVSASTTQYRSVEFLSNGQIGIIGSLNSDYGLMPAQTLRSADGGETWKDISDAISDSAIQSKYQKAICGLSHYKRNFYGVGWYGSKLAHFYKSADEGLTWETTYIDTNLVTGLVDVIFISKDTGFVSGTKNTTKTYGGSVVLKTTDGGKSWKQVFYDETIGGIIWKLQKIDNRNFVGSIQPWDKKTVSMIKVQMVGIVGIL